VRCSWTPFALLAAALLAACGNPSAEKREKPLETVDVTDQPDASATLETDTVARPRTDGERVAGVLPADFPRDVPLPVPSSLVDFSPRSVTLEVQRARAAARDGYFAELRAAGFRALADDGWQKGARRLRVTFADASGATRITLEIL
jgi:hypothetical protein